MNTIPELQEAADDAILRSRFAAHCQISVILAELAPKYYEAIRWWIHGGLPWEQLTMEQRADIRTELELAVKRPREIK